jgi:hypothetical protein
MMQTSGLRHFRFQNSQRLILVVQECTIRRVKDHAWIAEFLMSRPPPPFYRTGYKPCSVHTWHTAMKLFWSWDRSPTCFSGHCSQRGGTDTQITRIHTADAITTPYFPNFIQMQRRPFTFQSCSKVIKYFTIHFRSIFNTIKSVPFGLMQKPGRDFRQTHAVFRRCYIYLSTNRCACHDAKARHTSHTKHAGSS